jgi:hypothetical protein
VSSRPSAPTFRRRLECRRTPPTWVEGSHDHSRHARARGPASKCRRPQQCRAHHRAAASNAVCRCVRRSSACLSHAGRGGHGSASCSHAARRLASKLHPKIGLDLQLHVHVVLVPLKLKPTATVGTTSGGELNSTVLASRVRPCRATAKLIARAPRWSQFAGSSTKLRTAARRLHPRRCGTRFGCGRCFRVVPN